MSGRRQLWWRRSIQRLIHFVPAIVLGVFVYAPVRSTPVFVLLVQVVAFPALVISGLLMWKGGRLRRRIETWRSETER